MIKKISIITPVYNGEDYIAEAIESVLSQTYGNFEFLIGDDRSTDKSALIIEKYAKKDKRIRYIKNKQNLGCVKNINALIMESSGEYIKFLIQDDVMEKHCLEECLRVFSAHAHVGLVTSFQQFIGDSRNTREMPEIPRTGELEGRWVQRNVLERGNWIGGETAVMVRRKNLYMGLQNPAWVWQVDQDLWLRILADSNLYVIPKFLTYPRIHSMQGTVYLDKGYVFINEELMQLKIAFMFPGMYGTYSNNEQQRLYAKRYRHLIQKGLGKRNIKWIKEMIDIGFRYDPSVFLRVLLNEIVSGVKGRVFPKI